MSNRLTSILLGGLAVSLSILVVACGGDGGDQIQVFGYDDVFSPDIVEVPVGGEVEWRMEGDNPHNVFASDGSWESELTMVRGDKFTRTFDAPGVYPYFCTFHGTAEGDGMAGYVIVGDVPDYERPQPEDAAAVESWSGSTVRVPEDHPSIQAAVDAADPGDLVLVGPGVYSEAVVVRTPSLVIRGTDRNEVVLDGLFELTNGIHAVADGVAVENMTARNYTINGFYWTGVTGYRGSYLTAHNNGDYGLYAFDSVDGRFEHSYAEGNRDSGYYIGQCYPCNAVIEDVVSVANGLAYSGTNAGGDLYIINSEWRDNMGGIVPNSLDSELLPPQRETYIGGNLVIDNNNAEAPTKGLATLAWKEGIVLGGGVGNVVEKNHIVNHDRFGIAASLLPDKNFWFAEENVIRDNVIAGTGIADMTLIGPWVPQNCFEDNRYENGTRPFFLEFFHSCDGINLPMVWDLNGVMLLLGAQADANYGHPPGSDYRTWPAPGPQENMPDVSATPMPAVDVFVKPDLAAITVPELPEGVEIRAAEVMMSGVPVSDPTFWTVLFSLYGYFLPLALMGAWFALAVWDIVRRQDELSRGMTVLWLAVIFLIPLLGIVAYFVLGKSKIPAWLRWVVVGGGALAYLVILIVLALVSGAV